MTAAKALIDAGICDTVASNSNCGDNAISYFKDFEYNGERVIISSGIPDHEAEHDMLVSNPNTRCEHWQFMVVPLVQSQAASSEESGMGVVGLSTTGGHFFNHLSNPDGSLALTNEGPTLDSCFGHSAANGLYHYHANINCTTTDESAAYMANDPSACVLLGYYRDGVPVYGLCQDEEGNIMTSCYSLRNGEETEDVTCADGNTYTVADNEDSYDFDSSNSGCNLDEGNGAIHPTTGQYSYFMTTGYPWVPIKYFGQGGPTSLCAL